MTGRWIDLLARALKATRHGPVITEPVARQLYNAVKQHRAERGQRILTIPEIQAVLDARAALIREHKAER